MYNQNMADGNFGTNLGDAFEKAQQKKGGQFKDGEKAGESRKKMEAEYGRETVKREATEEIAKDEKKFEVYYPIGGPYQSRMDNNEWIEIISYDFGSQKAKVEYGEGESGAVEMIGGKEIDFEDLLNNFRTKEEEMAPARAAAWHTIHKIENSPDLTYADLLKKNPFKAKVKKDQDGNIEWKKNKRSEMSPEESDAKFIELTRKLWKEFAVHGYWAYDKNSDKIFIPKGDLDGEVSLELLRRAKFDVDGHVEYVEPGERKEGAYTADSSKKHGVVSLNKGESVVGDHHTPESGRDSSAAKFTYDMLVETGLLEKEKYLDEFVEFVTKKDNQNYSADEIKELFNPKTRKYSRTLVGLDRYLEVDALIEIFEKEGIKHGDELSQEMLEKYKVKDKKSGGKEKSLKELSDKLVGMMNQSKRAIRKMQKGGLEFDSGSRFGKVLVDVGERDLGGKKGIRNKVSLEFEAVRAAGFGAYVVWIPEQNRFKVYTEKPMDFDFTQGGNVRNHYWTKQGTDGEALTVKLADIIEKIYGKGREAEAVAADEKIETAIKQEEENFEKEREIVMAVNELFQGIQDKLSPDKLDEAVYGKNILLEAEDLRKSVEEDGNKRVGKGGYASWQEKLDFLGKKGAQVERFLEKAEKAKEDIAEIIFGKFFRDNFDKVDSDKFPKFRYGADIGIEAGDLTQKLNDLNDEVVGPGETYATWTEKLQVLKNLEMEVDAFLAKAEAEAETRESVKSNDKNAEPQDGSGAEVRVDDQMESKEERINRENEKVEELKRLEQAVADARTEYLEVDYKKNTGYKRLGKIFGRIFRSKEGELLKNDTDIAWYRAHYDNKLMDYKNALLDDWKARGSSEQELGEIIKKFEIEARINVAKGHDEVKLEYHEGRFSGFIREHSKEIVDRYNKLPLTKKIAIGAAFGIGAVGAGLTGSAVAIGVVASAATIRRMFMGVVTGTGAAVLAENRTQKNREKAVEKNTAELLGKLEGKTPEEIEELTRQKIDGLIYDEDQKINTIKNKNLRNLGIGIGAGLASVVAVPEFMKHGKEWFSHAGAAGGKVAEFFGHHAHGSVKPLGGIMEHHQAVHVAAPHPAEHVAVDSHVETSIYEAAKVPPSGVHHVPEAPSGKGIVPPYEAVPKTVPKIENVAPKSAPVPVHEAAKNIELNVRKGSSFEGAIIKHLKASGIKPKEAGGIAHRMYLEYIQHHPDPTGRGYNLVHSGARLELSSDGKHILNFNDHLDKVSHHAVHHAAGHNIENNHPTGAQHAANHAAEGAKTHPAEVAKNHSGTSKIHPNPAEVNEKLHPGGPQHHLSAKEVETLRHQPRPSAKSIMEKLGEAKHRPNPAETVNHLNHIDAHHQVLHKMPEGLANRPRPSMESVVREMHRSAQTHLLPNGEILRVAPAYDFHAEFHSLRDYHDFVRMAREFNFHPHDSFNERAIETMRGIAGAKHDKWMMIRDLKFSEARRTMGVRIGKRMYDAVAFYGKILGPEAQPGRTETVGHWVARMAKFSTENGGVAKAA